jgi:hypothetical protein
MRLRPVVVTASACSGVNGKVFGGIARHYTSFREVHPTSTRAG